MQLFMIDEDFAAGQLASLFIDIQLCNFLCLMQ